MTRPDKHAARFGLKYTCPPLAGMPPGTTLGQVTDTLRAVTAALPRMVDALRQTGWVMWQRPPEGLEVGEDGRYRARTVASADTHVGGAWLDRGNGPERIT